MSLVRIQAALADQKNTDISLKSVEKNIFSQTSSCLENTLGATGYWVGGAYVITAYVLGSGFGSILGNAIDASPQSTEALTVFFGLTAYLSAYGLFGTSGQAEFKRLTLTACKKNVDLPLRDDKPALRSTTKTVWNLFAACSGTPFTNILQMHFMDTTFLRYAIPSTSLLMSYLVTRRAGYNLIDEFIDLFSKESDPIRAARSTLDRQLSDKLLELKSIPDDEIRTLYREMMSVVDEKNVYSTLKKIHKLLQTPASVEGQPHPVTMPHSRGYTWGRNIASTFGVTIGILGAIVLMQYAENTGSLFISAVSSDPSCQDPAVSLFNTTSTSNITHSDTCNVVAKTTLGVFTYVGTSLFNAYWLQKACVTTYDDFASGRGKPTKTGFTAQMIASFAATPSAYLAITSAHTDFQKFLIFPSVFTPLFAQRFAFTLLLGRLSSGYYNRFKKDDPLVMRESLKKMILELRRTLSRLHGPTLLELNNLLTQLDLPEAPVESVALHQSVHTSSPRASIFSASPLAIAPPEPAPAPMRGSVLQNMR